MSWFKKPRGLGDSDAERLVEEAAEHLKKAAEERKPKGDGDDSGKQGER